MTWKEYLTDKGIDIDSEMGDSKGKEPEETKDPEKLKQPEETKDPEKLKQPEEPKNDYVKEQLDAIVELNQKLLLASGAGKVNTMEDNIKAIMEDYA